MKKRYLYSGHITTLLLAILLITNFKTYSQKTPDYAKVDTLLQLLSANNKFMGSVAIMQNGKPVYIGAAGYADMQTKTPNLPSTVFRIGSISKTFTSVMTHQLFEEKKLTPETPLAEFYPNLPNAGKITMHDLLVHQSGLWSITDDSLYMQWCVNQKTESELIAMIEAHPVLFEPRAKAQYSNTNFLLLGYIIEKITGKSYAQNLSSRIVDKAGLTSTYIMKPANPKQNESYSYSFTDNAWIKENETDASIPGGAGAIASTTHDLVRFITALFDGRLISKTSLEEMIKTDGKYARGIFKMPFYELEGYGHTGGIDGFRSVVVEYPAEKLSIALCSNGLNYGQNDLLISLITIALGKEFAMPEFKEVSVSTDILSTFTGTYASPEIPIKLTVTLNGNSLMAQGTGQSAFPLEAVSENEFKFDPAGIKIRFQDGSLNLKQGGMDIIMKKE